MTSQVTTAAKISYHVNSKLLIKSWHPIIASNLLTCQSFYVLQSTPNPKLPVGQVTNLITSAVLFPSEVREGSPPYGTDYQSNYIPSIPIWGEGEVDHMPLVITPLISYIILAFWCVNYVITFLVPIWTKLFLSMQLLVLDKKPSNSIQLGLIANVNKTGIPYQQKNFLNTKWWAWQVLTEAKLHNVWCSGCKIVHM